MALDLEALDGTIIAEADDIIGVAEVAEVARGGDEADAAPSHMDSGGGGAVGSLLARQGGEGCDLC